MTDYFTFYRSFYDAINQLPPREQLKAYKAIMSYVFEGKDTELSGLAQVVFVMAKPQLDASARRRAIGVENGKKGAEYGKLGGRPKKTPTGVNDKTGNDEKEKPAIETLNKKETKTEIKRKIIPVEPALISIPLNDGSEFGITSTMILEWEKLYPAVNVKNEIQEMRKWCINNPSRRKTKAGINRFINTWLSKEQDSGRPSKSVSSTNARNEYLLGVIGGTNE